MASRVLGDTERCLLRVFDYASSHGLLPTSDVRSIIKIAGDDTGTLADITAAIGDEVGDVLDKLANKGYMARCGFPRIVADDSQVCVAHLCTA